MKFDTDKVLINRDGDPMQEPIFADGKATDEKRTLTHGIVALRAIDAQLPDDKDLKAEVVRKRFALGARIMAGGVIDLKPDEAVLIQERVCVFGVTVAGPIIEAIDHPPVAKLVAAE